MLISRHNSASLKVDVGEEELRNETRDYIIVALVTFNWKITPPYVPLECVNTHWCTSNNLSRSKWWNVIWNRGVERQGSGGQALQRQSCRSLAKPGPLRCAFSLPASSSSHRWAVGDEELTQSSPPHLLIQRPRPLPPPPRPALPGEAAIPVYIPPRTNWNAVVCLLPPHGLHHTSAVSFFSPLSQQCHQDMRNGEERKLWAARAEEKWGRNPRDRARPL